MVLGKTFILDGLMLYHPLYMLYSRYVWSYVEIAKNVCGMSWYIRGTKLYTLKLIWQVIFEQIFSNV